MGRQMASSCPICTRSSSIKHYTCYKSIPLPLPKVRINDVDPGSRPAEVNGALDQGILIPLAFEMVVDLVGRRLAHIDISMPFAVACRNLLLKSGCHTIPPGGSVRSSDAPGPAS